MISHPRCKLVKTKIDNLPDGLTIQGWKYEITTGFGTDNANVTKDEEKAAIRTLQTDLLNMERALIQVEYMGTVMLENNGPFDDEIGGKIKRIMAEIR